MNLRYVNYAITLSVVTAAVSLALFLIVTDAMENLYGWKRSVLIIVLFLYSGIRILRMIKDYRQKNKLNETD